MQLCVSRAACTAGGHVEAISMNLVFHTSVQQSTCVQALCINEAVLQLGAPSLINERCLDLQKPASGSKKAAVGAAAGGSISGPQARKVWPGRAAGWQGAALIP